MKLFKKLASIYSGSREEEAISAYIIRWVASVVPDAKVKTDKTGNIYITRGVSETYPCVVAHLDQVQVPYPKDYKVCATSEIIFGYSPSQRQFCGLGADDKCGVWIALKMLAKHDAIKVAFFPGEEIGCVGSRAADIDFFSDARFIVEPDRRGRGDLITSIGLSYICSMEFENDIDYAKFGYKPTHGLMTDVETLKQRGVNVACINISCGYYLPHSEEEYVVKEDMYNALNFVDHIITKCTKVYHHKSEPKNAAFEISLGDKDHSVTKSSNNWRERYNSKFYDYGSYYDSCYDDRYEDWGLEAKCESFEEREAEWDNQYSEAAEFIDGELAENPYYTPNDFYNTYGSCFPLLTLEDVEDIFDGSFCQRKEAGDKI